MATVVSRFPIPSQETTIPAPTGPVSILPFQIVVLVSIAHKRSPRLAPGTPRFPAILDTAFNNTFLLQEQHFNVWAGLRREHFTAIDEIHPYGKAAPVYAANVWVHRNVPGTQAVDANASPFCIHLDPGIAVCPSGLARPRLPLLGLRAFLFGDLQLAFSWKRMTFSLYTTPWWQRLPTLSAKPA